jgi:hypothetical protein
MIKVFVLVAMLKGLEPFPVLSFLDKNECETNMQLLATRGVSAKCMEEVVYPPGFKMLAKGKQHEKS